MRALQLQLQAFGLNPRQWILKKENEKIRVIHRTDPTLSFIGTFALSAGLPKWNSLILAD